MSKEFSTLLDERSIAVILEKWRRIQVELEQVFKARQSTLAETGIKKATDLLKQFILLTNQTERMEACIVKPINAEERIDFILSKPMLYHSFIQLSQLFDEQEKLHAKNRMILEIKNKRPD